MIDQMAIFSPMWSLGHHMSQIIRGVNFKNGIAIVQDDGLKLNNHQELQKCAA